MKHRLFAFALAIAAVAVTASAQGPQGQGGGNANAPATGICTTNPLDMTRPQTVEGPITSLDLGYGVQYPSIVVNKLHIKVAPIWFLLDHDFELGSGETVKISAVPSTTPGDSYLYAVEITKLPSGLKLTLREADGQPVWLAANRRGPGNGNSSGARAGQQNCFDPASVQTAAGVVESVTAGVGIRQPVMVLKAGTTLFTIKLGPERILLDADFEIKAGATLTVKFGLATCSDEFIALEITNAAGQTIVLRNADGLPAWND